MEMEKHIDNPMEIEKHIDNTMKIEKRSVRCPRGTRYNIKTRLCDQVTSKQKQQTLKMKTMVNKSERAEKYFLDKHAKRQIEKDKMRKYYEEEREKQDKEDKLKTHYLKHFICSDSGICMAFGIENDMIKKMFDNFIDFKYATSLTRIGAVSANGFVTQVEYKTDDQIRPYKSYAILKSSVKTNADNLFYEYLVGKLFINRQTKIFPCFLETYGSYIYKRDVYWDTIRNMKKGHRVDTKHLNSTLTLQNELDEHNIIQSCINSKYLSVLVENVKDAKSLRDYYDDQTFLKQDLLGVLYQIYLPLSKLSTSFTHYDLHDQNVLIYKPFGENSEKYITYHYHLSDTNIVSFKSKYLVKIIDYGRSFFKDKYDNKASSKYIHKLICKTEECNLTPEGRQTSCGSIYGYGFLDEKKGQKLNNFITPIRQNISHDLRLLAIIKYKELKKRMKFNNKIEEKVFIDFHYVIERTIYSGNYGTKEITDTKEYTKYDTKNVNDAAYEFGMVIKTKEAKSINDEYYNDDELNGGDLHIYMDKPMNFIVPVKIQSIKSLDMVEKPKMKSLEKTNIKPFDKTKITSWSKTKKIQTMVKTNGTRKLSL